MRFPITIKPEKDVIPLEGYFHGLNDQVLEALRNKRAAESAFNEIGAHAEQVQIDLVIKRFNQSLTDLEVSICEAKLQTGQLKPEFVESLYKYPEGGRVECKPRLTIRL